MKINPRASLCFLFLAHPVFAQFRPPAAVVPSLKVSAGYETIFLDMPSARRLRLDGIAVDLTDDFRPRFGLAIAVGYANTLGSGRRSDSLTFLLGPVFYPARHRTMKTYIRLLVGGARISGPIPLDQTGLRGIVSRPSLAIGGGVEYTAIQHIYLRTGVEYLRTTFFGPTLTLKPQDNIRMSVAIGYVFGGQRRN